MLGSEGLQLSADAQARSEIIQPLAGTGGIDHRRRAGLRQLVGLAIDLVKRRGVVQCGGLQHLDSHRRNDFTRILVHNTRSGPRELDPIAVHHEGDRRSVYRCTIEAIEPLTRNIPRVTAVADHPGPLAETCPLPQRLPHCHRDHHPQAPAVERGATRQPRHVPGNIQTAAKPLDDGLLIDKTQCCQSGVITDRGMGVFDRIFDALVIADRQGQ